MIAKFPTPCRVLIVHNRYRERGGEDAVVDDELALLQQQGHAVALYSRSNDELMSVGRVQAAWQAVVNPQAVAELSDMIDVFQPDILHVHNTWMRISPAVIRHAARRGVAVVQTLHNYRLACPQALMLRDGQPCEDCVGRVPWPAVRHRCYRGSAAQSAVMAATVWLHRAVGTYGEDVDRFVALNAFCRDKMIEAGLPTDRIAIKPNFVHDPWLGGGAPSSLGAGSSRHGGLFVGRLSDEKGLAALSEAATLGQWRDMAVAGVGDWLPQVQAHPHLNALGMQSPDEVQARMCEAQFLVLPSIWYENFPRTLVEAYACGLPVIASRIGAIAQLVDEGETGLLFTPGSGAELADRVAWALAHPLEMAAMGRKARACYEARYTAGHNYAELMAIYASAWERAQTRRQARHECP